MSLIWSIYETSKDGKVTKEEFDNLTIKLADLLKAIF